MNLEQRELISSSVQQATANTRAESENFGLRRILSVFGLTDRRWKRGSRKKKEWLPLLAVLTGCFLFGRAVGGFAQMVSFSDPTNFAVGANPFSVAVGDFNGDGKQDLAVANWDSDNVSVLLGTGTGSFGGATNFAVGDGPRSVVVGDFNGDGKQDLAVANQHSNNVSILLGTGTGSFGGATNFAVGDPFFSAAFSVAVGDFNGDGEQDLVVGSIWPDPDQGVTPKDVSVLLGTGTGSFGGATNFPAGDVPRSVAVGDFNGDGKQDLVVTSDSNSVSVLLGTGTGSFGGATNFPVGGGSYSVAVGDFNGDGKQDLAVANDLGNSVSVLLGTGTGSFGGATNFAAGTYPLSVAVGDFNGDGKQDLAVANYSSANVSVLLGTGTGSFGGATNFAVGSGPASVAVGDFNGDGKQDPAVVNIYSNNVSILLNGFFGCQNGSLQVALASAAPGNTLLVTGTCNENVLVRNDKVRVFLDGGGTAVIHGIDPSRPALDIRGKAISIQGFTITGGSSGIEIQRGSNAVIDSNIIQNVNGNGVVVNQLAFGVLTNNTIQNNAGDGVIVKEGAAARIGFNTGNEVSPIDNTIQGNGGNGITVAGSSSARILGNDISTNGGNGVEVMSAAQADISNNAINNNGGDGIHVTENSTAQLGEDQGLFAATNSGAGNGGFGLGCDFDGALDGLLGTLTGNMGATNIDSSCPNSLSP